MLDLLDKLIRPTLFYGYEVLGLNETKYIERIATKLKAKSSTLNDFIYGELSRLDFKYQRLFSIGSKS